MKKAARRWRERQLAAQQRKCAYCDCIIRASRSTVEHVVPRAWGGPNAGAFNRVVVCRGCNRLKSAYESAVMTKLGLDAASSWTYGITGRVLCQHLLERLEQESRDEKLLGKLGSRRVAFSRIRDWVLHTMEHPGWIEVVSHRYEKFFGQPHPTQGSANPLAFL